nr:MAG TPA: hypothetical protein [Caudoviricetes sp.]
MNIYASVLLDIFETQKKRDFYLSLFSLCCFEYELACIEYFSTS